MEQLAIDVFGPLPQSSLIAADNFTKWVEAYPLANQEAVTVAEVLVQKLVSRFGVPLILHSNQGRNLSVLSLQRCAACWGSPKPGPLPFIHNQTAWWNTPMKLKFC